MKVQKRELRYKLLDETEEKLREWKIVEFIGFDNDSLFCWY